MCMFFKQSSAGAIDRNFGLWGGGGGGKVKQAAEQEE